MTASHPSDNRRFIVQGLFLGSGGRDAAVEGRTARSLQPPGNGAAKSGLS